MDVHSPREDDWALVKEIKLQEFKGLRSINAQNIGSFMHADRGEVLCKILEWTNDQAVAQKPDYEAWTASQGFELIKDPVQVLSLRQQIAALIKLANSL